MNSDAEMNQRSLGNLSTRCLLLWVAASVGMLVLCVGVGSALLASNRGFDLTDESLYIGRAIGRKYIQGGLTNSHLIWGTVLIWVKSVQGLRIFKIAVLLVAHGCLAFSFMKALPSFNIKVPETAVSVAVFTAVISASLVPSIFMPQTPGYNELSVVMITLMVSAGLGTRSSARAERANLLHFVCGLLVWGVVLARSGSSAVVPFVGIFSVFANRASLRETINRLVWWISGILVGASLVWVAVSNPVNFVRYSISEITNGDSTQSRENEVFKIASEASFTAVQVVGHFWKSSVIIFVIGFIFPRFDRTRLFAVALVSAFVLLLGEFASSGMISGGHPEKSLSILVFPSLVFFALSFYSADLLRRRFHKKDCDGSTGIVFFYALMLVAPVLSSFGTDNNVFVIAMVFSSFWVLLAVVIFLKTLPSETHIFISLFSVLIVILISYMSVEGTWKTPYRQDPLTMATVDVGLDGPLSGLLLSPEMAAVVEKAQDWSLVFGQDSMPRILALHGMPGLVLVTGGNFEEDPWLHRENLDGVSKAIKTSCLDYSQPLVIASEWNDPQILKEMPVLIDETVNDYCASREYQRLPDLVMPDGRKLTVQIFGPLIRADQ